MNGNSLYYFCKPFITRKVQIAIRRWHVAKKRSSCTSIWPINEQAGFLPEKWKGWPEGKQFALVLTHDVEGLCGLQKLDALVKLEKQLGFRSSFNFVGQDYQIPPQLFDQLRSDGFEVGLHGLWHHGNMFDPPRKFLQAISVINRLLKEWKVAGFRAPSMYHDLDLLCHLNIDYDSSTFDTDPYEPQPDGVSTIFPFNVTNGAPEKSYVELPYTMPQDFLLFVLMKESNINIWKTKLDWIAQAGGMALLITHPDYMNFKERCSNIDEYPAKHYSEFLEYVCTKYEGRYWHVLPREMSNFWKSKYSEVEMKKTSKESSKLL